MDPKEIAQSKYSRKNVTIRVGLPYTTDLPEHVTKNFNNRDSYTNATIKHPHFCPTGAKCKSCHNSRKGWMKDYQRKNIVDI